eukprot:4295589-Prorocentrum_lima.AAC.1
MKSPKFPGEFVRMTDPESSTCPCAARPSTAPVYEFASATVCAETNLAARVARSAGGTSPVSR